MSPAAMGDTGDTGDIGDTGVALSHALLCVTSLGCALRARQVTGGPAAGFLLQALVAASSALSPLCPSVPSGSRLCSVSPQCPRVPSVPSGSRLCSVSPQCPRVPSAPPGSWLCSVLAQPLVAFGCHRLSGDGATAALLVASGTAVAVVAARWPEGGRVLAGHCVTALTAGSLLALAALTGSVTGAAAAVLVALGDAVAPWAVPWVRVAASVTLLGTLREQRRAWAHQ